MSDNRNGRPTQAKVGAASVSRAIKNTSIVAADGLIVWCSRCGAVLTAERSVRLELGPVCRLVEKALAA